MKLFVSGTTRAMPPCMLAEEAGVPYDLVVIDIRRERRPSDLLAFNPQGRVPALIDGDIRIDQSIAILIYLADKFGIFLPRAEPARSEAIRMLMFTATDIMFGHSAIFRLSRRNDQDYSGVICDYRQRLLGDIHRCDQILAERDYLAGDISIADLMLYAIVGQYDPHAMSHLGFPRLLDWTDRIRARPAVRQAEAKCPYAYDVSMTLGQDPLDSKAAVEGFRPVV